MKPARAASRRFLPGSPFNAVPVDTPIEQFTVLDQVTHDKYGLGRVVLVEDDDAVIVSFGSRKGRIFSPFAALTKLLPVSRRFRVATGQQGQRRADGTLPVWWAPAACAWRW